MLEGLVCQGETGRGGEEKGWVAEGEEWNREEVCCREIGIVLTLRYG